MTCSPDVLLASTAYDELMVTVADFGELVGADLGDRRPTTPSEAVAVAQRHFGDLHSQIEEPFGRAGFYGGDAVPYPTPATPVMAPPPLRPPKVMSSRALWIGRWDPSDQRYRDGEDSGSDIGDSRSFPWHHPESALSEGWWIGTETWRSQDLNVNLGDLVIVQRQRPAREHRSSDVLDSDRMLIGVASVGVITSWLDEDTGRFESEACLVPLCRFDHPVPLGIARRIKHRMEDPAFRKLPALPDGSGLNRQLSAVPARAAVDLLSVCGVSPEVLAEPDVATIASRLRATSTGNKEYLDLRFDHQIAHSARRANELTAEESAEAWARARGYTFARRDAHTPLLGYDLLFRDDSEHELQVEVKGYSTNKLQKVHLQPSQVRRATDAASGKPPDWRLYVLLRASTSKPRAVILHPGEVLDLVRSRGISIRQESLTVDAL